MPVNDELAEDEEPNVPPTPASTVHDPEPLDGAVAFKVTEVSPQVAEPV